MKIRSTPVQGIQSEFTLMELLVDPDIIAILVAILFPAFKTLKTPSPFTDPKPALGNTSTWESTNAN